MPLLRFTNLILVGLLFFKSEAKIHCLEWPKVKRHFNIDLALKNLNLTGKKYITLQKAPLINSMKIHLYQHKDYGVIIADCSIRAHWSVTLSSHNYAQSLPLEIIWTLVATEATAYRSEEYLFTSVSDDHDECFICRQPICCTDFALLLSGLFPPEKKVISGKFFFQVASRTLGLTSDR